MRIYRSLFLLLIIFASACSDSERFIELGTADGCDASVSTCRVQSNDIALELSLGPGVKPLQPFSMQLNIKGSGIVASNVIADFQMKGMDMGMNRYRLISENGLWKANATLPVCVASRADWLALIEFEADGKKYRASFPFQTFMN